MFRKRKLGDGSRLFRVLNDIWVENEVIVILKEGYIFESFRIIGILEKIL